MYLGILARRPEGQGCDYLLQNIFDSCSICVSCGGGEVLDQGKQDIFVASEVHHSISAAVLIRACSVVCLAF
jgi:hypothetical protein